MAFTKFVIPFRQEMRIKIQSLIVRLACILTYQGSCLMYPVAIKVYMSKDK